MWRTLTVAAFATSALIASVSAGEPIQWRDLTRVPAHAQGRYEDERASEPTGYTIAEGDFDGDGQPDQAALYFHGNDIVVAARLSTTPGAPIEVWRAPRDALEDIGVAAARPGRHTTACFRYNWGCGEERTAVQLNHEAIVLINFFGPAEWVYFWENDHFEHELINE
ncbi:MAG: hypothetical protein ABL889_18945 [Terricaulis sp.]